jgi:hypothetical protein
MKKSALLLTSILSAFALMSCQTTKPTPPPAAATVPAPAPAPAQPAAGPVIIDPGQSLIQTESLGFSPSAANGARNISFALLFAKAEAVKSWKVVLSSAKGNARSYSGSGAKLPSLIAWDGRTASGSLAPEGAYTASLSVDYGKAYTPGLAKSTSFILDITKPTGKIVLSPELFSPLEAADTLTISIEGAPALARIASWSMDIFDPEWGLFRSFSGKWPSGGVVWDGKGIGGDLVVSAEDYPIIVKLRDEFGNEGSIQSGIPIDILVIKQGNGYRIENSRVYFKDFTADYRDLAPDLARQNVSRLDQLAAKLKKFPGYKIKIVGHAVMIHWDDPAQGKIEQESVLLPLSKARAEAIRQAMIDRGVDPATIETEGAGAGDPLVPDSDYANRWRNRRTAIFLVN